MGDEVVEIKQESPLSTVPRLAIYSVHYQRLVSLGNFENERIGAHAAVEDDQTPEQAIEALKNWVNSQLALPGKAKGLEEEVSDLERSRDSLQADIDRLREKYIRAKGFIEGLGLKLPPRYGPDDDMPF